MLIEFSVGNFWSFKEIQTLQMQATKTVSKYSTVDANNIIDVNKKLNLLKTKAIFGANASGKTNLIKAFIAMHLFVKDSIKDNAILFRWIAPFLLDDVEEYGPSYFQILFIVNNTIFRYGFEVTRHEIISEWLFGKNLNDKKSAKERYYFIREGNDVKVNDIVFKEGSKFVVKDDKSPPLYRDNSLFLSVVAAWNGQVANEVLQFITNTSVLTGLDDKLGIQVALRAMDNDQFKKRATGFLKAIDSSIQRIEKAGKSGVEDVFIFRKSNNSDKEIPFWLSTQVAEGTRKIFSMCPFIFGVLDTGDVLVVDEFDAGMHPNLIRKIIELFHSPTTNPNNAQLVFVTHDTNLLDAKLLRRDQISFTKKLKNGSTEIYSLVEFKGVRNDASFEKDYLSGKYDAVPTNLNYVAETVQTYITNAKKDKSD